MSKRSRDSQDDDLPPLKRQRVDAIHEVRLQLLDILTTGGIGDAFYASFDPLTQRALCCVHASYHEALKDRRSPLLWQVPSLLQRSADSGFFREHCSWIITQGYWRAQQSLALLYDHGGRFRSLLCARDRLQCYTSPYPDDAEVLFWAVRSDAFACIRELRTWLHGLDTLPYTIGDEAILLLLELDFAGIYRAAANNILIHHRWALLKRIVDMRPGYIKTFLVKFRKRALSSFLGRDLRSTLITALKPYGKKVPEHAPSALKNWLTKQLAQNIA